MILWLLKLGITMLIHSKDDIELVTEFPCFLGHPVENLSSRLLTFHFNLNKLGKGKIPAKICSPLIIPIKIIQSVPRNMGIQWRIGYRLCYELALYYLISKAII